MIIPSEVVVVVVVDVVEVEVVQDSIIIKHLMAAAPTSIPANQNREVVHVVEAAEVVVVAVERLLPLLEMITRRTQTQPNVGEKSKHLTDIEFTIKDILSIPAPLTIDKLIAYILTWYENKSLKKLQRSKIPIMTESLLKKTNIVVKILKMTMTPYDDLIGLRIHQRIRKVIKMINETCHMAKKQAPVVDYETIKKIAKSLWEDISVPRGSNIKAIRHRKAAATALLLSHKCGTRWKDLHRIHWEDLQFSCRAGKKVVQAALRLSKNNLCNDFPQALTWAENKTTSLEDCPWKVFKRWWSWCGKPKNGPIFANRDGSAISDGITFYHVKQHSTKKLRLPSHKNPTKHSGRVTTVLTLEQMNVSKRRIMRNMNWRSDQMVNYYMNRRDMQSENAPALLLSNMSPNQLKNIQKDLI